MEARNCATVPFTIVTSEEPGSRDKAHSPQAARKSFGRSQVLDCHDSAFALRTAKKSRGVLLDFPVEQLFDFPLFHGLPSSDLSEIAAAARELRVPSQRTIFREDDPVRRVYILARGSVKVTQVSECGKEVILRVERSGGLIDDVGEARASVHTTTAHTLATCRIFSWEVEVFRDFLERFPAIHRNAALIMAGRLKALEQRFCDVTTNRVPQRLARILLQLTSSKTSRAEGPLGLSREELAQMTGTTSFTVSRLLSEWSERGIVQVDRKAVVVEELPLLLQLAQDRPELVNPAS